MSDLREKFFTDFCNSLTSCYNQENINTIASLLLIQLDKYELAERCTELMVQETTSEQIIKIFLGSLLTEGKSKRTVKAYADLYKMFLAEIEKPLLEVTTMDIRIWLAKRQQKVSLATLENNRAYLSSLFTFLATEDYRDDNPMIKIKPIKFNSGIKKAFSDTEIDKLRSACINDRERSLMEVLLTSGVRVEEAEQLNISDIDFTNGQVDIRAGKGNKPRKTFVSQVCLMHLKRYLVSRHDSEEALFVSKYKVRLSTRAIALELKRIAERAQVEKVHPHKFRRTFATNLFKKGMDLATIQMLMGHSEISTTMKYIVMDGDRVAAEYKKYVA